VCETHVSTTCKIEYSALHGRYRKAFMFDNVFVVELRLVNHDTRRPLSAKPCALRDREVNLRRIRIGKAKYNESSLVRKCHARTAVGLGPQDRFAIRRQRTGKQVRQAIDAPRYALQPAALDHAGECPAGNPGLGGPLRGHEPVMLGGEFQERIEMSPGHVRKLP